MNCRKLLAVRITTTLLLALPTVARAAVLDDWELRNPLPHANQLRDLTSGMVGGQQTLVAVGQFGTITTSSDGSSWVLQDSGTGNTLNGVVHVSGVFTAVGDSGTILSSADAVTWNPRASGTASQLTSLAVGNGRYVAVGRSTRLVSTDGINWSPGSLGANPANLNKVAFGAGVFVAVGTSSASGPYPPVILRSTDGLTWSLATLPNSVPTDAELRGVTFDQGQFVVIGGNFPPVIYTSPDGMVWTQRPHSAGALFSVASGNGRYAAVGLSGGSGFSAVSMNGVNWFNRYNSLAPGLNPRVAFGGGVFLALGAGGIVQASADGLTYAPPPPAHRGEFWDILHANGRYIAVGDSVGPIGPASSAIFTSADGALWSSAQAGGGVNLHSVAYGNGIYVAVGDFAGYTSTDGLNWAIIPGGSGASLWGVTYGDGLFVGVGANGAIVTSPDGVDWTPRTSGVTGTLYDVAVRTNNGTGNRVFVAVGALDNLAAVPTTPTVTSPDGITWTPVVWNPPGGPARGGPAPTAELRGVAYLNGQFVAVGFNNQVRTSANGLTWVARVVGIPPSSLFLQAKKIVFVNGTYVIVGHGGAILSSPDLVTWQLRTSGTSNDLNAIATDGVSVVVAGLYGTILQSGGLSITGFTFTGGVVQVRVITQLGKTYHLERTSDFLMWLQVDSVIGNGLEQTLSDSSSGVGLGNRFYRASVQ